MNRREFLSFAGVPLAAAAAPGAWPMGLNTYCLRALRWHDKPLLDYCAGLKLDAVFLQDSLDPATSDPAHWKEVRDYATRLGLHLETGGGGILPRTPDAFEASVKNIEYNVTRAKALGSPIVRCVLAADRGSLPPGPAEQHMETAIRLLRAVRSRVMDAGLKLAIEVHKDFQAWEHRIIIESAGREFVGTYLDTGNPVFVLEDPMTTLEELAPFVLTVHLRDSVVYEHPRGIAVQWVPLGEGHIDFKRFLARAREICPPTHIYIKPITGRPPYVHQYLDPGFWKTYPKARAGDFARFLAMARGGTPYDKPMVVEDIPGRKAPEAFTAAIQHQQKEHMERSIAYARRELGLGVRS